MLIGDGIEHSVLSALAGCGEEGQPEESMRGGKETVTAPRAGSLDDTPQQTRKPSNRQSKLHEVGLERDGIRDSRLIALEKEGWPSPEANGGGNGVHEVQWRSGVQRRNPGPDWLDASGLVNGKRGANLELIAPACEKELARWMGMPAGKHMDDPSQPGRREIRKRRKKAQTVQEWSGAQASRGCAREERERTGLPRTLG
jgi:hypothetical protein